MKILFSNLRPPYPFIIGGDGPNIDTYFTFLTKLGHQCEWLGTSFSGGNYLLPKKLARLLFLYRQGYQLKLSLSVVKGHLGWRLLFHKKYSCHMVPVSNYIPVLRQHLLQNRPDVILTQLEGADRVIRLGQRLGIPVVLFLTDAEASSFARISRSKKLQPSGIVCVSQFVADQLPKYIQVPVKVFPPPLLREYYQTQVTGDYITCVNPVKLKGGEILRKIVQHRPNDKFLIVKGWYDPLDDGLDFRHFPNVELLEKQTDMRLIYQKTKLLLVPSLWNEALPRVILEAGTSGIPVIASNRGGIIEAVKNGGTLIKKPRVISLWLESIDQLLTDAGKYAALSQKIRVHTKKFEISVIGPRFEKWLHWIVNSGESNNR